MKIHNHNLNIHYSLSQDIWDKVDQLYSEMPFWSGFIDGNPQWYSSIIVIYIRLIMCRKVQH
ncbi:hypothetical protein [Clostridium sp. ZBS15]|uniref:hypothetical protein n=1 Tax=Clostridium sp. ZBS15 TaxID=2949969 RepID=UPI00207A5692|nr:hypothetical protein [Clostridium sp. ZBS15]